MLPAIDLERDLFVELFVTVIEFDVFQFDECHDDKYTIGG
jgi:hypothetical protein